MEGTREKREATLGITLGGTAILRDQKKRRSPRKVPGGER